MFVFNAPFNENRLWLFYSAGNVMYTIWITKLRIPTQIFVIYDMHYPILRFVVCARLLNNVERQLTYIYMKVWEIVCVRIIRSDVRAPTTHEERGLPRFGKIRRTRRPAHAQPQKAAWRHQVHAVWRSLICTRMYVVNNESSSYSTKTSVPFIVTRFTFTH